MSNTENTANATPVSTASTESPVLVLGATGSFAGAVTQDLLNRGIPVRALVRDRQKLVRRFGQPALLEIQEGDVQDPQALAQAATGCRTIVQGVNYPYHQWFPNMETATRNVMQVAQQNDALIVFPGNVYSLGRAGQQPFTETSPHNPVTRKGSLRRWMEDELKAYADQGGRVLIVRAGDYFGPTARNGYVDALFEGAARGKAMTVMGNLSLAHQWAYVPDLARATVDLLVRADSLKPYEVVNFSGSIVPSQRAFMSDIARVAQSPDRSMRLPWVLLRLVALFSPLIREVMEMKYLWESTVLIDGPRFEELLPDFRPTPLDAALAATLDSYRTEDQQAVSTKSLPQAGQATS
jgi:nucleoside-diphosphate-sugar epimerase